LKRIGIVYDRPLDQGGVESHLLSIVRCSKQDKFEYYIYSPFSDTFLEKLKGMAVTTRRISPFPPISLQTTVRLRILFQQDKIDLVHLHSPIAAIPGRLAGWLCRLPVIVTVHLPASRYYGDRKTLRSKIGKILYTGIDRLFNHTITDKLIYVSSLIYQDELANKRIPKKRSIVIQNGINLDRFHVKNPRSNLREILKAPANSLILIVVGRLDEQKGIDVLLQALAILTPQIRDRIQVWIVGSGPIEDELKRMTWELRLGEYVSFLGYREDVVDYLYACDIFVLPSRYEGMPISLLESMAAGLPSIVTDVGENSEVVGNNVRGLVVSPLDHCALADAIESIIVDNDLRESMGRRAKKKALEFSEASMVLKIEELYQQISYTSEITSPK